MFNKKIEIRTNSTERTIVFKNGTELKVTDDIFQSLSKKGKLDKYQVYQMNDRSYVLFNTEEILLIY